MVKTQDISRLPEVRGLLIDIDGVLRIVSHAVPGAPAAMAELRRRGVPFRLLTNVTMKSRREVAAGLHALGIPVEPHEVYTASSTAAEYLRRQGPARAWVLLHGSAHEDFTGLELTDERPDFVVLGDMGDEFGAPLLNRVFRALLAGARLLAIQHNPAWTAEDGPRLDVGAWVAALEYASRQEALVMGKPSPLAYQLPAAELGLPMEQIAMVADDFDVDLVGAARVGLRTIMVRTTSLPHRRLPSPGECDRIVDSIADVPAILP